MPSRSRSAAACGCRPRRLRPARSAGTRRRTRFSPVDGSRVNATPVARVVAEVAEHHRLHVDGRAPVVGDVVELAVGLRALVVPGPEDGADRAPELLARLVGKVLARAARGRSPRTVSTTSAQVRRRSSSASVGDARAFFARREHVPRTRRSATSSTTSPYISRKRRRQSSAKRSPDARREALARVVDVRPRFRIVSIIPGIEERAPDRTETSSGSLGSPKRLPGRLLEPRERLRRPRLRRRRGSRRASTRRRRPSSIVKPGGTGMPSAVISARPEPLPPRRLLAETRALRLAVRRRRRRVSFLDFPFLHDDLREVGEPREFLLNRSRAAQAGCAAGPPRGVDEHLDEEVGRATARSTRSSPWPRGSAARPPAPRSTDRACRKSAASWRSASSR